METEKFNFSTMKSLFENGQLKDRIDCKNYVAKFFHPLTNGSHAFIEDGKLDILNDETMTKVYLKRFHKDIKNWYSTETIPKNVICDIFKPRVGEDYVNLSSQLIKEIKEFASFPERTKKSVQMMLDFLKKCGQMMKMYHLTILLNGLLMLSKEKKIKLLYMPSQLRVLVNQHL
jgi:hypothetical protein